MEDDRFEWSAAKARVNLRKHGLAFEVAKFVFDDPASIDEIDDRESYGEPRFNAIGMVRGEILTVTYTERGAASVSSLPGRRHDVSRTSTSARASRTPGRSGIAPKRARQGTNGGMNWAKFEALTDEDVVARAMTDPDNRPLSEDDLKRMKRRPRAYIVRRALRMTQEEFSEAFRIPIGTLRDWEQGRTEPDQASRAYLKVIAVNPEFVRQALAQLPGWKR